MDKIYNIIKILESKWKGEMPLFKLFDNGSNTYLYDTGTNKIFKCTDVEYSLLSAFQTNVNLEHSIPEVFKRYSFEEVESVLGSIIKNIDDHNILSCFPSQLSFRQLTQEFLRKSCTENLNIMVLEITQNCNLRCRYCLFDGTLQNNRRHNKTSMSDEIAYQAVDLLYKNSKAREEVALTFYGGEPLLKFNKIKKIVEYAKDKFKKRSIHFSLTTNATFLSEEIAKYLLSENFNVVISLDGPENFHDEYRIFPNGRGSFKRTISGITNLLKYYTPKDVKNHVILSIVFAPPYTKEKLDAISTLFDKESPLRQITPRITYPLRDSIPPEYSKKYKNVKGECNLLDWAFEKYYYAYPMIDKLNPLVKSVMLDSLIILHKRKYVTNQWLHTLLLNSCCIPSQRRMFVSAKGEFHLCERVQDTPSIGSIEKGIDYKLLYKIFVDQYSDESIKQCSTCWSNRICNLCYTSGFVAKKISMEIKELDCKITRFGNEKKLIMYSKLLEKDKNGLDYISKIKIA